MNQKKRDENLQNCLKTMDALYQEFLILIKNYILSERVKVAQWNFPRTSKKMKELSKQIKKMFDDFYVDRLMPVSYVIYTREFEREVKEIEEMIEGEMRLTDVKKILSEDISVDGLTLEEREKKNNDALALLVIGALRQTAGDNQKILDFLGEKGIDKIFYNFFNRTVKRGVITQITRSEWLALKEMDEQNKEGKIKYHPEKGYKRLVYVYHCEPDNLVCDLCLESEGDVFFDFDDAIELPQHPNCRCWYQVERYNSKSEQE